MSKWRIECYKGKGSQPWRWRLKAPNNKIVATAGEGFKTRCSLVNNIVRAQIGFGLASISDRTPTRSGKKP